MHDVEEVEMFDVFSSKSVTQTSWSELFQFLQEDDLPETRSLETWPWSNRTGNVSCWGWWMHKVMLLFAARLFPCDEIWCNDFAVAPLRSWWHRTVPKALMLQAPAKRKRWTVSKSCSSNCFNSIIKFRRTSWTPEGYARYNVLYYMHIQHTNCQIGMIPVWCSKIKSMGLALNYF